MKILAIRIRNLASLEGITEIDFTKEPLKSAGIFAITGPTGAGKSTILDALCLALYAKIPRYVKAESVKIQDVGGKEISQDNVGGILRDGTAEGFAEVDFIGIDGHHYRAGWHIRRAGNKADGKLQGDTVKLENITTGTLIPGKKKETLEEIERLIGLSFEQFTRSVLLAQGDFTAFLKAGKDEKASLLEKLTGIRIYSEISMLVFEKNKHAIQELQLLQHEIGAINLLDEKDIEEYKKRGEAAKGQIESGEKQLEGLLKEIEWWKQLKILQENTDSAQREWEDAIAGWKNTAGRAGKLKQVESVQKTRSWIENIKALEVQEEKTATDIRTLKENLQDTASKRTVSLKAAEIAETALGEQQKREAAAAPLMEKALELDVLLKERKELIGNREKELEALSGRHLQTIRQLEASVQKAASLAADISGITKWQDTHRQREPVADNVNLVISKLADASGFMNDIKEKEKDLLTEEKRVKTITTQKQSLELERLKVQQETESVSGALQKLTQELQQTDIDELERELRQTDHAIDVTRQAAEDWNKLYQLSGEHKLQKSKLAAYQAQQQENEVQLKKASADLKTAETKKQTSEDLLKKALIQASENIGRLRETLEDGEPCPVCGSMEHPYTKHHPVLDNVIATLEEAHEANERSHNNSLKILSSIQQKEKETAVRIRETEATLSEKAEDLKHYRQKWNEHNIMDVSLPHEDEQKTIWLSQRLQSLREQKAMLQARIEEANGKRKTIEAYREQITTAGKETDRIVNSEKDAERTLITTRQQITRLQQEKQQATDQLVNTEELLSPYFPGKEWVENWKANPSNFVQRIREFAGQWKANRETLEKAEREHSILSAAILKEQLLATEEKDSVSEKERALDAIRSDTGQLQSERTKIFDGRAIKEIEQQLADAVTAAEKNVIDKRKELEQLNNSYTRLTTQVEHLLKIAEQQRQQISAYTIQISEWLDNYNMQHQTSLTPDELTALLSYTHEWIEEERKNLKAVEDKVTRSRTVFEERKINLTRHGQKRISEKTEEELVQLKRTEETTLEKQKESLNEIRLHLRQDEENRKRAGHIQKQIIEKQDIAGNWGKLNDLVGSADGKKFRQVAQEYTLEVLIAYANVQLNNLSKRYTLQRIPDSLSLQVIDKDMGNEIRTIYSLSGGESFLVSLALALGLASLSSNQVKVESLFIDEGFGSLDPVTLATVMDALDRLHNQGRKVGVISHVEEMTERIPAQIRVVKLTSGRSKVETDSKLPLF